MEVLTDGVLRGLVIERCYARRTRSRGHPVMLRVTEFGDAFSCLELERICEELKESGLLEWIPLQPGDGDEVGQARLTAEGIDVAEGTKDASIPVFFKRTLRANALRSVRVGNSNSRNLQFHIEALARAIDNSDASEADKAEARLLLSQLMEHRLMANIVGV